MEMDFTSAQHLVLYDGDCALCNGAVRFVMRHDRRKRFRYAPLKADAAKALMRAHGLEPLQEDSFAYWRKGRLLTRSTAALRVAGDLGGAWRCALVLLALPRFLRDPVYGLVARNRHRWGSTEACPMPNDLGGQ